MRTTRRGTERCGRIRRAATDLFLERGYDGVSVDDIIARAGGSKTNVYSHFGGKDGLFVAVVETLCDEINAKLKARDLTGLSLEQGLRVLGSALLAELLQDWHLALYRLVIAESARFPEIGRAWGAHGPETSCRVLTEFIASRQPAEAPVEPHRAATLFHDMILFEALHRAVRGLPAPVTQPEIDHLMDEALAVFTRGYAR